MSTLTSVYVKFYAPTDLTSLRNTNSEKSETTYYYNKDWCWCSMIYMFVSVTNLRLTNSGQRPVVIDDFLSSVLAVGRVDNSMTLPMIVTWYTKQPCYDLKNLFSSFYVRSNQYREELKDNWIAMSSKTCGCFYLLLNHLWYRYKSIEQHFILSNWAVLTSSRNIPKRHFWNILFLHSVRKNLQLQ